MELQRVNHTQHFVDVTAQRQVVNNLVANDAVSVDQEGTAQRNAFVRMLDAVSFLNFTFDVGNHRVFNRANTALVYRGVTPCVVNELGVKGNANHFYAAFLEFFVALVESDQFRRANESEIHWPEEQDGSFTVGVLFEVEFLNDFAVT